MSGTDAVKILAIACAGHAEATEFTRVRLEMARIRSARAALLAALLKDPHPKSAKTLLGIDRYDRKVVARRKRLLRASARPVVMRSNASYESPI